MIWEALRSLPDRKLLLVYRFAKSNGIGDPRAIDLKPWTYALSHPVRFSDQSLGHCYRVHVRTPVRPSLRKFFRDPRDMVRLRNILYERGLLS